MAILSTKGGKARESVAYHISGALLFSLAVLAVQRMQLSAAVDKPSFGVDGLLMEVCPETGITYAGWGTAMMSNIPGSPYLSWEPAQSRRPKIKNTPHVPWIPRHQVGNMAVTVKRLPESLFTADIQSDAIHRRTECVL
jgi:hypothetical protein